MSYTLITWASSWIGKAMALQVASQWSDVFLIARRENKLQELATHIWEVYGVKTVVLAIDLTHNEAIPKIMDSIKSADLVVDVLINNAGFGGLWEFIKQSLEKNLAMIDLNIKAVVSLTHRLLPMLIENKGKILTVWSTAWFMPGPLQATYFATKAFINSRSQALWQELKSTGVTTTVLCPGATATEFAESADASDAKLFQGSMESADDVARAWLQWMQQWKRVVITDPKLWFVKTFILPFVPMKRQLAMIEKIQRT